MWLTKKTFLLKNNLSIFYSLINSEKLIKKTSKSLTENKIFIFKNKNFNIFNLILFIISYNFLISFTNLKSNKLYSWDFSFFKKKITLLSNWYVKAEELELKGINFRFSKYLNIILMELGCSHFHVFSHPKLKFITFLKKKKNKKILFLNNTKNYFLSCLNFFRFQLKSVGPYKLKGFQFLNEWIKLKAGKKPFK